MAQKFESLESQACFRLYAASREVIKRIRPEMDALGLTYTQYVVMAVIWEENAISVRDLGRTLYLDSGTLTPVLKTLEKAGYITRRRCQEDERVLIITVTEAGLKLKALAENVPAAVERAAGLTEKESASLRALLGKVLAGGK